MRMHNPFAPRMLCVCLALFSSPFAVPLGKATAMDGSPSGERSKGAAAPTSEPQFRRTLADLRALTRHGDVSAGAVGRQMPWLARDFPRRWRQEAQHLSAFIDQRLDRIKRFRAHATPQSLSSPWLATASATLGFSRTGPRSQPEWLSLRVLWVGGRPGVDGVVVFDHGRPRWPLAFPRLLREYDIDLSGFQYDYMTLLPLNAVDKKDINDAKGPALPGWRTYPLRHRHWRRSSRRRLGELAMAKRHGTGFWKLLRRRASGLGGITIALTKQGKVVGRPLRIPIVPYHMRPHGKANVGRDIPASRGPPPGRLHTPISSFPVPPNAPAWMRLQIFAYNHVWFHKKIHVRHWRRKMGKRPAKDSGRVAWRGDV